MNSCDTLKTYLQQTIYLFDMNRKFINSDNHKFHRHGRMVVEFTTTYPIVAYHHSRIYIVERI